MSSVVPVEAGETRAGQERLHGIETRARGLLEALSPAQLNWKPSPGAWSIGECTEHVNRVNRSYLDVIAPAVAAAKRRGVLSDGPFRYGWFERWFVGQLEPPVKRRFKSPAAFRPAEADGRAVSSRVDSAVVGECLALLEELRENLGTASGVDLARVKVVSPVSSLIRFRLGMALQFVIAHTDRHLQQAERVRENPAFPTEVT